MIQFLTRDHYQEAAAVVSARSQHHPRIGLILGSGLSALAESVEQADSIPYSDLPYLGPATVEGHLGCLILGYLEGQPVIVMQGRLHYYEGYSMAQLTLPIRVMQLMGVDVLIITNAAGGLNPAFRAGDLMLISDHINLISMAGLSPLRGPNDPSLGPRFPDMSEVYNRPLRELALRMADDLGLVLRQGVYVCLGGPNFETPADLRFLRMIGADAVGMSTVPEAVVARHGGLRVLGISGISNVAQTDAATAIETTHEEVLQAGQLIVPKLSALLRAILRALPPAARMT
ncbi:MAG: purine-nucleoside phosphorylase [Thermoflexales bacterium]|nr:purine-nucleoside phosphorylase [Thermoflexales bacterium]